MQNLHISKLQKNIVGFQRSLSNLPEDTLSTTRTRRTNPASRHSSLLSRCVQLPVAGRKQQQHQQPTYEAPPEEYWPQYDSNTYEPGSGGGGERAGGVAQRGHAGSSTSGQYGGAAAGSYGSAGKHATLPPQVNIFLSSYFVLALRSRAYVVHKWANNRRGTPLELG